MVAWHKAETHAPANAQKSPGVVPPFVDEDAEAQRDAGLSLVVHHRGREEHRQSDKNSEQRQGLPKARDEESGDEPLVPSDPLQCLLALKLCQPTYLTWSSPGYRTLPLSSWMTLAAALWG